MLKKMSTEPIRKSYIFLKDVTALGNAFRLFSCGLFIFLSVRSVFGQDTSKNSGLLINEDGYFEMPGLNIMMFDDFYPEGHQGGMTIIQNGSRIAANRA